jgi:hypothetical protein
VRVERRREVSSQPAYSHLPICEITAAPLLSPQGRSPVSLVHLENRIRALAAQAIASSEDPDELEEVIELLRRAVQDYLQQRSRNSLILRRVC